MTRYIMAAVLSFVLAVPAIAEAANWGSFKSDECTGIGYRQYSAILWNIPWGYSWERACAETPATINGHYFSRPTRCVNTGTHMWGEFDVPDDSCPHWGDFSNDGCYSDGVRRYSSILWDIPWGYSWETACANEPATVGGYSFSSPTACVNTGTNMWGQFYVSDANCACGTYPVGNQICNDSQWCRTAQYSTCIGESTPDQYLYQCRAEQYAGECEDRMKGN